MKYKEYKKKLSYPKLVENDILNRYLNHIGYNETMVNFLINSPEENAPYLMNDLMAAVDYIINNHEDLRVFIVGDYDADGCTSTAIMLNTLSQIFPDMMCSYYIPHRVNDGYGLSVDIVKKIIDSSSQINTIITVDNGIAAHEAIQFAKDNGFTVILTDHHEIGDSIPNADFVVHPALVPYPYPNISGATVAYKFCNWLIDKVLENDTSNQDALLALKDANLQYAAISVVSDVMPVGDSDEYELEYNENRTILKKGLELMRNNPDWRLDIFFDMFQIQKETMDETTIGFYVSPLINAVGRLDDASDAVRFLTATNEETAIKYASWMGHLNEKRKGLKKEYLVIAKENLDTSQPAIVAKCEDMHEGLIGIIAGNLKEEYQKPAFVFAKTLENGLVAYKASARSTDNVNLYEVLKTINDEHPGMIAKFGGHSGAAGLTVMESEFDAFALALQQEVFDITASNELEVNYLNIQAMDIPAFAKSLEIIKPLGRGLPKPLIRVEIAVNQIDFFFNSEHVKLTSNGHEYWLYGALSEFYNQDNLHSFYKTGDNTQKKTDELKMSPEEAYQYHWERWKCRVAQKFELYLELDYGQFMNQIGPVPSVRQYKKM